MKSLIVFLLGFGLAGCFDHVVCPPEPCGEAAFVIDYTGMDGCGLLFELEDGTKLIPSYRTYIQPPTPQEDPIYHYNLTAGEKVYISYKREDSASACMMGDLVFITCIRSALEE